MNNRKRSFFTKNILSNIVVVCVGVLFFLALFRLDAVAGFVGMVWGVIFPFVIAIVFAYLLNLPMRFFERTLFKKCRPRIRRTLAVATTYLLVLVLLGLLMGQIIPQIAGSVSHIAANVERYLRNLNGLVQSLGTQLGVERETLKQFVLNYGDIVKFLTDFLTHPDNLYGILGIAGQVGSGVYGVLVGLIASVYMLAARDKLLAQCRRLLYAVAPRRWGDRVMRVSRLSNKIFSGFISGTLIDSALVGVLCFVFMSVMNILSSALGIPSLAMPFSVLISVIIGVTNIIPFFGPFIGAIPSALILLMVNPWGALWFVIFIIVMQQIDGNIIAPRILGGSTGLPAMWVFVSLIVFGAFFGFGGMLLGVPTTAVVYALASSFVETRLRKKGLADEASLTLRRPQQAAVPYAREADGEAPPGDDDAPTKGGAKDDTTG